MLIIKQFLNFVLADFSPQSEYLAGKSFYLPEEIHSHDQQHSSTRREIYIRSGLKTIKNKVFSVSVIKFIKLISYNR